MKKGICKYKSQCAYENCQGECKVCKEYKRLANLKYRHTENGHKNSLENHRKIRENPEYVEKEKVYRKARYERIKNTEKYKNYQKEMSRKRRLENSDKIKARSEVSHAIASGKLVKPNYCQRCNIETSRLEAHHSSYDKEKWLDVIWLCIKCHKEIHIMQNGEDL